MSSVTFIKVRLYILPCHLISDFMDRSFISMIYFTAMLALKQRTMILVPAILILTRIEFFSLRQIPSRTRYSGIIPN